MHPTVDIDLLGLTIERIAYASRRHALSAVDAGAGAKGVVPEDECDSLGASLHALVALLGREFRAFDGSLQARAVWKSAVHVILSLIAGIADSGGAQESENEGNVRVGTCESFSLIDRAHQ